VTARLVIHVPGNPWQGAVNRRDRAAVSRSGKPYNRKQPGFRAYQDRVAQSAQQASVAQRVAFGSELVRVWITLGVPDRRCRDLDGPVKAILDGLTQGGVWDDDAQVWDMRVRKVLGQQRATVVVRRLTDGESTC